MHMNRDLTSRAKNTFCLITAIVFLEWRIKPGYFGQVIGHERYVGGFDCSIRAHGAHGYPYGCGGQCRSVVDSVSDHSDPAEFYLEFRDQPDFILGEQFRVEFIDSNRLGDQFDGFLVVAADHDHFFQAESFEKGNCPACFRAHLVGNAYQSADVIVAPHHH